MGGNRKLEQERLMDEDFGVDVVDREDAVTERLMQQPPNQA